MNEPEKPDATETRPETEPRSFPAPMALAGLTTHRARDSFSNMLEKNAEHLAFNEDGGCYTLDFLAKAQKLILSVSRMRAFGAIKGVHSSAADLTFYRLVTSQHCESEGYPLAIVSQQPSPRQRHPKPPPAPACKMRASAGVCRGVTPAKALEPRWLCRVSMQHIAFD
jgi:hypothetical protein